MHKLFFSVLIIISHSCAVRTLHSSHHGHHLHHGKISFIMQDIFSWTHHHSSQKPTILEPKDNPLPFPKPLGFFPPVKGIPIPGYNPKNPETQTLDLSSNKIIGVYFPAKATLQEELVSASLTAIDQDLFQNINCSETGPISLKSIGKAQGVSVAISGNEMTGHHMVAANAFLGRELKDGIRVVGLHKVGGKESHVAVIGGFGKYSGANGYATIRACDDEHGVENKKLLLFNVYLG